MKSLIINKNDLRHNINVIKKLARLDIPDDNGQEYNLIGVVKGNGYGLGLIEYSKFLIDNGIRILAVATVDEALKLRELNKNVEILDMSSTSIKEELEMLIENDITITIGSNESAELVNEIARKGKKIKAHLKIDTGFGRYGFIYQNKENIIKIVKQLDKNIEIQGIFTHFSLAYYKNSKSTLKQYKAFIEVIDELENANIKITQGIKRQ